MQLMRSLIELDVIGMPDRISVHGSKLDMKYLVSCVVLMLMLSIGMSVSPRRLLERRRLTLSLWARLVVGTFLVPPLLALALGNILSLDRPIVAGLFLIAVVPGAPLMTRGAAQKGFDLQLAASYQVWARC